MSYRLKIGKRNIDNILNEIKTKIPKNEISVDLSTEHDLDGNEAILVNTITADNYVKVLNEFSNQVTALDMSHNLLGRFGADLITVTKALPENLTSLEWHDNSLDKLDPPTVIKVFEELPRTLVTFGLRGNALFLLPVATVEQSFKALPETLKTLDLSGALFAYSADDIVRTLESLPKKLESLDLGLCGFNRFTADEWVKILRALPEGLIELKLGFNRLAEIASSDWPRIMAAMPQGLKHLDLSSNWLSLEKNNLAHSIQYCPKNLTKVSFNYDKPFDPMVVIIENEINRLMNTHTSKNNIWVGMGIMEASDAKVSALDELKEIISRRSPEITDELSAWHEKNKDCLKVQRNKIHTFFQPEHKAGTQTMCEDMLRRFGVNLEAKPSIHASGLGVD